MESHQIVKSRNYDKERRLTHFLYVLPSTLLYTVFTIVPIVSGLYYSFTNWNGISRVYKYIGVQNYLKIFSDRRFIKAISFNITYAAMLILCVLILAVILALALNANRFHRTFFQMTYFFPACISMLTIGLVFNYIYFQGVPALGYALNIPWLQKNILSSKQLAVYGILIANIWKSVAIPTVLIISALQTIPNEIIESSKIDGANAFQRFRHIIFRFILPTLSIIFVLLLKEGLMIYDYIVALTGGGPAGATESITMSIYRQGFEDMKFSYAISQAMIVAVIISTVSIFQIKMSSKKKIYD